MERNQERRDEQEKRVPIRAAATLAESRDDAFEADAVNLSRGGMSLRSPCLPDLGARLWCRFEHPPSGSIIEAEGEVVWAQLEGESGEIGLAFTSLDPQTEMLIEQIIAQHGSPTAAGVAIDPGEQDRIAAELDDESAGAEQLEPQREPTSAGREAAVSLPPMPSARVANLSLEGISEPLSAHVAELSAGYAVFEQVLPLLKLGRTVSADAPELQGRRGAIAGVELRMMGHVPTLAVLVEFADGEGGPVPALNEGFGEASFSSTDVPAVDESLAHDTEPDLDAPSSDSHPGVAASLAQHVTEAEFSASPVAPAAKPATSTQPKQLVLDVPPAPAPAAAPRMARAEPEPVAEERMPSALTSSSGAEQRPSARGDVDAAKVARPVNHRLDATQVVDLESAADGDVDDASFGDVDPFAPAPPAWKPFALAAMRALHMLAGLIKIGATRGAKLLGATGVAALPRARMFMVRARAVARQASIVIAPKLGAARRMAAAQLGKKKRRTTSGGGAAARESSETGSLVRTIGLGALVTLIAGLGVYAVLPTGEPELELHRAVEAPQGGAGLSGGEVAPSVEPAAAQALDVAQPSNEPALPMPSAATVPSGSAFAVDVREKPRAKAATAPVAPAPKATQAAPPAPKAAPRSMRFGASTAPARAQTFALRMSKPIDSIKGLADVGGFTVIIDGSLSLDRAGPISAAHRGVARAMVLNKGDRAELTIRFADGKKPAYQVRADGQTLYVVIEDV